jgi:hypothetical protein
VSSTTKETRANIKTARAGESQTAATAANGHEGRPVLAIVVPCLNEELVIKETVRRLVEVLKNLTASGKWTLPVSSISLTTAATTGRGR